MALETGEIDHDTYLLYLAYALYDREKLPPAYQSSMPRDFTLPLLEIQQSLDSIRDPAVRAEIESLLANTCWIAGDGLTKSYTSAHFYIEYENIYAGLTIADYASALETAWVTEVGAFGWAAPPLVIIPEIGPRYHVVIDDLNTIYPGLYGYVYSGGDYAGLVGNNPNTAWNDVDAYATCMGLNNNYDPALFPSPAINSLQATVAHEFNHAIQYGYGALTGANAPDDNFIEGGATWMEDEVFDAANDNQYYLWPSFNQCMGDYSDDPYAYWITFRGLTEPYGTGAAGAGEQIMQDFWESVSQSALSNALSAMDQALINRGSTLADAYHHYAVAVKFNKPCGGGYPYPYCFEEGAEYVAKAGPTAVHGAITDIGDRRAGIVQDNYALNWISLPAGVEPIYVTLENNSTGGDLRLSLACDTGAGLRVAQLTETLEAGESGTLHYFGRIGCGEIVAVITNLAQTAPDPTSCTPRSYTLTTGVIELDERLFLPLTIK